MKRAKHINMTEKEFESEKRLQFKFLINCFYGNYGIMLGSYYLPEDIGIKLSDAYALVKEAHKLYLSIKTHRTKL